MMLQEKLPGPPPRRIPKGPHIIGMVLGPQVREACAALKGCPTAKVERLCARFAEQRKVQQPLDLDALHMRVAVYIKVRCIDPATIRRVVVWNDGRVEHHRWPWAMQLGGKC